MTPEELQELRNWSALKMGWTLQPYQYGSIPGNVRMSWVSIKDNNIIREYLQEEWFPDRPESGQIWMLVERIRELGFWLSFIGGELEILQCSASFNKAGKSYSGFDLNPCIAILQAARATEE